MTKTNLLRPSEACERLGVCRKTLYAMVNDGRLPNAMRIKKHIRIPESDVEGYIAKQIKIGLRDTRKKITVAH